MQIFFFFEDVPKFSFSKFIPNWISETVHNEGKDLGEINIVFCTDKYLLKMNKEHLNHDYYTDIITFDYCIGKLVSGDLFISVDRVGDNAKKFTVSFNEELMRVIIHGVLHLISYNDKTDDQQKLMTQMENFYLNRFEGLV